MKKRTRLWSILLTISLLLTLLPTTALAGGFETTTYDELVAKLANNSEVSLDLDLNPTGDFGWPTEPTTLYINNEIYLMSDWEVPEHITLVFGQSGSGSSQTNGRIYCSTYEPHTLTLNGNVRKEHASGNEGFLDCNIIFAGNTIISGLEYFSILVGPEFTWTVKSGASLTTQYPNYDGSAMVAGILLLRGALTGNGTVNSRVELRGAFGGGPWDTTITGNLTLTDSLSIGSSKHDILTIPADSTLTLSGNGYVQVKNGTLNVEGMLKEDGTAYNSVQIQQGGILQIHDGGSLQTLNNISVNDGGTLFLDHGGEMISAGRMNLAAGSTFRLADEYETAGFLMLWDNVTNPPDPNNPPSVGATIQLDETGVLHAYESIEVSTSPKEGSIIVPGAITGSGTIMLHDGKYRAMVTYYDEATGKTYGRDTNDGTIPGVDATVKIVKADACTHDWSAWEVTKVATCSEEGSQTRTCSLCNKTETQTIAMTDHTVVIDETVAATCEKTGLTAGSHCSVCGEVIEAQKTIPALGHDWTTNDCTQAATCKREGCTATRNAGQHIWGEWTVTQQPTCTEPGSRTHTCTSCGHEETEAINKIAHTEVTDPAVPATCTAPGKTAGSHCSVCQTVIVKQTETAALGHTWGEWIVTKEPTEAAEGEETRTCSRCNATEIHAVSKLERQEVSWIIASFDPITYGETNSDGTPITITNTAYTNSDGGELRYSSKNPEVAVVDPVYGTVTIVGVGTAEIVATAAAVDGKYVETSASYFLTIDPAPLTITANDVTITYGQAPANGGYTATGLVNGDKPEVIGGTAVYAYAYTQYDDVGRYTINVSGLSAKNYAITYAPGTLTVGKATDYIITLDKLEQLASHTSAVTAQIAPWDDTAIISVEYSADDGATWTETVPTEAGTYAVRAALTASDNIVAAPTAYTTGTLVIKTGVTVDTGNGATDVDVAVDVDTETGKAEITVSEEDLKQIVDNADGDVSIDLGGVSGVDELVLPGDLVKELSKSDKADSLTVSTEDASITMSAPVLDTVAKAVTSGEDTVAVKLTAVEEKDLTSDQQQALNKISVDATIVEVSLIITHPDNTTTELHQLGGNVEVTVPFAGAVPAGQYIVVCYVSDDGNITYVRATYDANTRQITFNTNHFSTYAVFVSGDPAVVVNDGSGSGLYAEGATITIKADSKSGYRFNKWEVVAGDVTLTDASKAETTFTMPGENVELTATYTKITSGGGGGGSSTPTYTVTAEKTKNGSVTISSKSAVKGDTVTIAVKPDKGYELDTLKVFDKNGDKVKVIEKNGKYTFTMPASKVTVEAVFIESKTLDNPFADVNEDAYYFDAVLWAVGNGVTSGTTATTFAPDATCTRAQTVTFLWRAAGSPVVNYAMSFTDVPADAYYAEAVRWAVGEGITSGTTATTFSPDATVTRAQTVTFLWRAAGSPKATAENPFVDVAADAYYANAVLWAAEQGITSGTSATTFGPSNNCTRAQIVTFIFRDAEK